MADKDESNKNIESSAIRLNTPSIKFSKPQIKNSMSKEMGMSESDSSVIKLLSNIDTELLFPTQLKSYYASAEF